MRYALLIYVAPWESTPEQDAEVMAKYNSFSSEALAADVMRGGEALHEAKTATSVRVRDGKVLVTDGPFAETKELVAGYWVWNVKSMDEALEWAKRCPNPMPGEDGVLELRPTYADEDFGEMITEEHRDRLTEMRKEVASRRKAKAKPKAKPKAKAKTPAKSAPRRTMKRRPVRAKAKK